MKRDLEVIQFRYDTRKTEAMKGNFLASLAANREQFIAALSISEEDNVKRFIKLLLSKKAANRSIYALAKSCDLTCSQIMEITHKYCHSGAMNLMFQALGQTAQATIEDAQPTHTACPRCDGMRKVEFITRSPDGSIASQEWRRCPGCKGKGTVRQSGSSKAQEMLYRATKVLEPSGPLVAIQNNQYSGPEAILDDLDRKYKPKKIKPSIELEVESE